MTMTQALQKRGWSDQLILLAKIAAAIATLATITGAALALVNTTMNIPRAVHLLGARVDTLHIATAGLQRDQTDIQWYLKFLVQTECARLSVDIKSTMRNAGGIDCDQAVNRIPR